MYKIFSFNWYPGFEQIVHLKKGIGKKKTGMHIMITVLGMLTKITIKFIMTQYYITSVLTVTVLVSIELQERPMFNRPNI